MKPEDWPRVKAREPLRHTDTRELLYARQQVMDEEDIRRALTRMAHEVLERNRGTEDLAIIGIQTRGAPLAERLADLIEKFEGRRPMTGSIDITGHRDDRPRGQEALPSRTDVSFDITGKRIILVDEVIFTGRTVRAAMDALTELGRPALVQLAVLVDRGHRELPIRPDYVGKSIPTSKGEHVSVRLREPDGHEAVVIERARH
jgi:pyrimidine operon attenuation protein/uracil phosphoribosyltransferase